MKEYKYHKIDVTVVEEPISETEVGYVAYCDEYHPECVAQGDSIEEAVMELFKLIEISKKYCMKEDTS